MPVVARIRTLSDVVAVVPQLLGFVPDSSLVAIFTVHGRTAVTARIDVDADADSTAAAILRAGLGVGADRVLLIGYGEPEQVRECVRAAVEAAAGWLAVDEVLLVSAGRWRHLDRCGCCPTEGTPVTETSAPALEMRVYSGREPAASRAALAARLDPTERAQRVAAVQLPEQTNRDMLTALGRLLSGSEPVASLPDDVLASAARGLCDLAVRDVTLSLMCAGTVPMAEFGALGELARETLRLPWTGRGEASQTACDRLAQACPAMPGDTAWPLAVLAVFSWWNGDGALAGIACERSLAIDPACPLARLADRLLESATPPPM